MYAIRSYYVTLIIGIFFQILFGMLSMAFSGFSSDVFAYLDLQSHYSAITRGVIDSKDLIYFASLIFAGLAASELSLIKRNLH